MGDERASAREVSQSNLHVPCRMKVTSRNSAIINFESPYSSQDPKKRMSVQLRTCTDTPIALSKPHHIGLCSRSKFEHNQFGRSQDIEAWCARAHVHSDTPWACSVRKVVSRSKFTEQMFTLLGRTKFQNMRINCFPFSMLRMAEEIL